MPNSGTAVISAMWAHFQKTIQRLRTLTGGPAQSPTDEPVDAKAQARAEAGIAGERAAEKWLRAHGMVIITRNWRNPHDRRDELDLVCRDGEVLVFVEVKTRAHTAFVPGYHTVDRRKKKVLRRTITAYLRALRTPPASFRFDVVEVSTFRDGSEPELRHFENVPLFSKHFQP